MSLSLENQGVLTAVLERFEKQRLPRILDLKELVDQGGTLNEYEIDFLEAVLQDTQDYQPFVAEHAEYRDLFARTVHLYHEITTKALENEKKQGNS
jgi:hypothetical protein